MHRIEEPPKHHFCSLVAHLGLGSQKGKLVGWHRKPQRGQSGLKPAFIWSWLKFINILIHISVNYFHMI